MRKISNVILGLCLSASLLSAQTYDQIVNGPSYVQQAYYQLSSGTSQVVMNDAWDLAFSALGQSDAGIHLNESSSSSSTNPLPSLELYLAATNNFSQVLQASDLTDRMFNPETSWTEGAFNIAKVVGNPFDYGWGVYNTSTNTVEGNRVFGLKLRDGNFKKLMIEKLVGTSYTLKVADLDNGNPQTTILNKANAAGSPLLYFSLSTGIVNNIPAQWDLVFERYSTPLLDPSTGQYVVYNVLGVLSGKGLSVAKASGINPQTVSFTNFADSLSSDMDKIGYDWKTFGTSWSVATDLAYFVKTNDNHLWKIVFIDFEGSSTGVTTLEKTDLGLLSTINNGQNSLQYAVYPSLAKEEINIAIESKDAKEMQIELLSMEGKKVWEKTINPSNNLSIFSFTLPSLPEGIYQVVLKNEQQFVSQSIMIQP